MQDKKELSDSLDTKISAERISELHYRSGLKYYHGNGGVSPNMKLAREQFELCIANNKKHGKALQKLGDIYECGRGVIKDFNKAIMYYRASAQEGDVVGMFCLGHCYELGRGVAVDLEKAADFYRVAYSRGYEGWRGYYNKFLEANPKMKIYLNEEPKIQKDSTKSTERSETPYAVSEIVDRIRNLFFAMDSLSIQNQRPELSIKANNTATSIAPTTTAAAAPNSALVSVSVGNNKVKTKQF